MAIKTISLKIIDHSRKMCTSYQDVHLSYCDRRCRSYCPPPVVEKPQLDNIFCLIPWPCAGLCGYPGQSGGCCGLSGAGPPDYPWHRRSFPGAPEPIDGIQSWQISLIMITDMYAEQKQNIINVFSELICSVVSPTGLLCLLLYEIHLWAKDKKNIISHCLSRCH